MSNQMSNKNVYGPWIKWHGGECPVMRDQEVTVKLRNGVVRGPARAAAFLWEHHAVNYDIVEYCAAIEQADLEAAEKLLRANNYTIIPPAKPLTFEDVKPLLYGPEDRTEYWVLDVMGPEGVASYIWRGDKYDELALKRRMAYLDREHAIVAAEYIFGLKGGAL